MKKRKKLLISIFSVFAFILSIFSISNVYANNGYFIDNNNNVQSLNLSNASGKSVNMITNYTNVVVDKIFIGSGQKISCKINYYDHRSSSGNGGLGVWYGNNDFDTSGGWTSIFNNQRIQLNEQNGSQSISVVNYTMPDDYLYIIVGVNYNLGQFDINLSMVNKGETQLDYFPYGTYYNSNYLQISNLGIFSNLGYVQAYMPNHTSDEYDLDFLLGNGYFESGYFDLNRFNLFVNPDYSSVRFYFYFDTFVSNSNFNLNFSSESSVNLFRITGWNSSGLNSEIYVYDDVNLPISFNLSNYSTIPYEVESFDIGFNSSDDIVNIISNQSYLNGYNSGYNSGYYSGKNDNNVYYKSLYDNLVVQYNDLQYLYNDYLNGNVSFNTLVWNIATIPFESFKQIWNVDLLGLNIGNFVIALMFVGVVVYIWKKFL